MAFHVGNKRDAGDTRGVLRQWLREFFLEDWSLKVMALVITMGLWYAVTAQRAPAVERVRNVPLEFVLPANVEIGNDPVDEVSVTLEGSQSKLDLVNPRNLVARADVTELKPGDRVARLSGRNVSLDLPEGVRIVEVTPRSVTLRLEPVVEREVEVEARFEGELPEGFSLRGVQVEPGRVRVRGPESHVAALAKVHTETIALEGQRESIERLRVAIDIPDSKVAPLETAVAVRVEIVEQSVERRFAGVPVEAAEGATADPPAASVTLRGPRSLVEGLRPEDVRLVLEVKGDGSVAPRLALRDGLGARVELVSTSPSSFNLNR
jgi:YbbR domain-containing protein